MSMETLEQPSTPDFIAAKESWEKAGYTVHGLCPECQWGFIVDKGPETLRAYCTAYGQCERAPG